MAKKENTMVSLPTPDEGMEYHLLPPIPDDRRYVSLSRSFTKRVVIEDDGVDETFKVDPNDATDEANDSAYGVGYGRYIYPGTITAMKGGTRLDAVQRKADNFVSVEFVASTGGLTSWESEGKKHLNQQIRNRISSVKNQKGEADKWYMANGADPEKVFLAMCVAVAATMEEADSAVIFARNWPSHKTIIEGRVAIVEENAARVRALNATVGLDLLTGSVDITDAA